MKKNRCFKLTALLLIIAMVLTLGISGVLAVTGDFEGGYDVAETTTLDTTFVKSATVLNAKNQEVKDLAAQDPNGSFILRLNIVEPEDAENAENSLPESDLTPMVYELQNMTAVNGANDAVEWEFSTDAEGRKLLSFYWKAGKKNAFTADVKVIPAYPTENDLSGSYVLGTARKSMLGTKTFTDTEKNRDKLFASEFTESDSGIRPAMDENPVWVLEHVTGNYYTVRAQNTNKFIYISPVAQGTYKASSLYLVEGTRETAQKILVTDVGGGYYSFTYLYNGQYYAINNSNNDKAGNSAIRGFGCWTYQGYDNEKFKLYSPSSFDNSATVDLSGTWVITNTSAKVSLTSEASQANRLAGSMYSMKNGVTVAEDEIVTFTFEHVIRDWYTVKTDAGYLNITKEGAIISSTPQHLMVKTDDNYGTIMLTTGEYTNSSEKYCSTYALNYAGDKKFGSVISKYSGSTRMQLVSPSGFANAETVGFLLFNKNGGTAVEVPQTIAGDAGEKVILPEMNGTKNGQEFIGWCEISDAFKRVDGGNGTSHTYHDVYTAGSIYTLKSGTNTLYAVYNSTKRNVRFGIRIDGVVQDEPNGFPSEKYTGHFWLNDDLKVGKWIVDIDSTKPVNGYTVANNVTANLNYLPTADQISEALKNEGGKLTFDPETQYVHWYVLKYTTGNGGEWHVDGVIRNKELVGITYNVNVAGAEKTSIASVPGGYQVLRGTQIQVGTNKNSQNVLTPVREGYVFTGWNTESDGTGESYTAGKFVRLTSNLNLYAQWKSEEKLIITITSDWEEGKPAYAGTEILLTAHLSSGFEGKTYTLQWQHSIDKENWVDVEGAHDITHTYTMTTTTAQYYWRVVALNVKDK